MRLKFICISILFAISCGFSEYAPNILINPDVDQLIYRLASRYHLKVPENQFFQPLNHETVKSFLNQTDSLDIVLSATERFRINIYNRSTDPYQGLLKWSSNSRDINIKLHLKLSGDIRSTYNDNASIGMRGIISPFFCGNLGKFSFYSGIDVWTEYRSDTLFGLSSYQPYDGIPYNLYGKRNTFQSHIRSSDIPRGGLRYDGGPIQLETAIDYLKIGPAVYFPVTLSGTAPPINYIKGTIDLGIVNYVHVAGLLKAQKDKMKYLYVHRLNASFWHSRLNLGINEVIITGSSISEPDENDSNKAFDKQERQWEWAYLIPFIPFKFVEHYVGDRDNAALSFDLNLIWPVNFRWYLEFFLDDILSPAKIFSSDWGNKWAATVGVQYFGSAFNRDLSINAEYSRVEPWVYTHFYGGSHRYSHFDRCLGSPLGPNSQAIVLSVQSQIHKYHEIGIGLTSLAKNSDVRGGKLTDVFQNENLMETDQFFDNTKKRFLGPGTKWQLRPSMSWSFNTFGKFSVKVKYEVDLLDETGLFEGAVLGGFSF